MREAGRVVARTLETVREAAEPGIPLAELDAIAARCVKEHHARPIVPALPPEAPYPSTVCLSVNDVVVHGVPGDRVLREGDLLSVDCGAEVGGHHGDAAIMFSVGAVDEAGQRLMDVTRTALERAIEAAVPGNRMGDIAHAVERTARAAGYGIPEGLGGARHRYRDA